MTSVGKPSWWWNYSVFNCIVQVTEAELSSGLLRMEVLFVVVLSFNAYNMCRGTSFDGTALTNLTLILDAKEIQSEQRQSLS